MRSKYLSHFHLEPSSNYDCGYMGSARCMLSVIKRAALKAALEGESV
jgi:hypothetical protein